MITPRWIIRPTAEELHDVGRFLNVCRPDESTGDGVWVHHDGSQRIWSGGANGTTWQVRGGLSFTECEPMFLPARVVREAEAIAGDDGGGATILVPTDESVAIVSSASASTVIDLQPTLVPAPTEPEGESAAVAVTTAGALTDLLGRARHVPTTGESEEYPDPVLTIVDGVIAVHTDWSVRGGCRTTYRLDAKTTGSSSCVAPLRDLFESVRFLDDEIEVTISIPANFFDPIVVRDPGAWSTYRCLPADARRHSSDVLDVLIEMFGEETEIVDYGSFGFELEGQPFTVQLLDVPEAIVRVATTVCDLLGGQEPSEEVLRHLNEVNSGLVAGRIWTDGERVWGAIDLPVDALDNIPWAIEKLRSQLEGFDVFLGAIAGEVSR